MDPGLSHVCTTNAGLLGGRQDRLLIRTACSGNSWPGQGGGKCCYLKATPSGRRSGKVDGETGSTARTQQQLARKTLLGGSHHRCTKRNTQRVKWEVTVPPNAALKRTEEERRKAETAFAFSTAVVLAFKAFQL